MENATTEALFLVAADVDQLRGIVVQALGAMGEMADIVHEQGMELKRLNKVVEELRRKE